MTREHPHKMRRGVTVLELAKRLGVDRKTVIKYTSMPRVEYEANSISRAKPWEAMKMSRAAWYYKGKPSPQPQGEAA